MYRQLWRYYSGTISPSGILGIAVDAIFGRIAWPDQRTLKAKAA